MFRCCAGSGVGVCVGDCFRAGSGEVGIEVAVGDSGSGVGAAKGDASFEFDGFGIDGSDGVEAGGEGYDGCEVAVHYDLVGCGGVLGYAVEV